MAKEKTVYFCKECGFESPKWLGQCPGCKAWNSFAEGLAPAKESKGKVSRSLGLSEVKSLSEVSAKEEERFSSGISEFDRVLGGGIVKGSLVLVGGDPGIGKSTLLLQVCRQASAAGKKVLYVSGEESPRQIKMRADRLGEFTGDVRLLAETDLDKILDNIKSEKPDFVVIDSIQTMFISSVDAAPGSVSQVREATLTLMNLAKGENITVFLVGHVTKEGVVAGPRTLEHMVDTVLYFEGENIASYRMLRAVKNRFGSTNEVGVFEMSEKGLREVLNPSEYMLAGSPADEPGSVVTCIMEGTRPMLIEVQALVSQTNFNLPRRAAAGTDYNRVNLLMAVLEKRMGLSMGACDAYVNIAGGIKVAEPGLDLAICLALVSSYKNRAMGSGTVCFGEIGLTGEIRGVGMAQARVAEAKKLGFKTVILPAVNKSGINIKGINVIGISNIRELNDLL
ncbi:MAG: DNA repair protein RadA [Lachnospiraceae bacterium]|nr:DNA repair protein RadA [Lachnospiraceae bacterium]